MKQELKDMNNNLNNVSKITEAKLKVNKYNIL